MTRATWRPGPLLLAAAWLAACSPPVVFPDSGTPPLPPPPDAGVVKDCRDADGDGYPGTGDCSSMPLPDCVDTDPSINPGVAEVCDGLDNNCNYSVDEGLVFKDYYPDLDQDLYGAGVAEPSCKGSVPGKVTQKGDCDDTDLNVHPGASEYCNGKDDDCNGTPDDNVVSRNYYTDADGDSFGTGAPVASCQAAVLGKSAVAGDCNDSDPAIHPGATELCNDKDDNCDGTLNESFPGKGVACLTGELGVCSPGTKQCVNFFEACKRIKDPVAEICDGLDNNCNGTTDESFPSKGSSCSNGLGVCARFSNYACGADGGLTCPVDAGGPTAPACDGLDNDCNGVADEFAMGKSSVVASGFSPTAADVAPMHLSTSSCNGGNTPGSGTDAWISYLAAYVSGAQVFVQQVREDGSALTSPPLKISGVWTGYQDVAVAQAGPGMLVLGQYGPAGLDLFYLGAAPQSGAPVERTVTPPNPYYEVYGAGSISNPRVVRAGAGRAVLLWRERDGLGSNAIRMARVSFAGANLDWTLTTLTAPKSLITNGSDGAFAVASNTPEDLVETMTCPGTTTRFALVYKVGEQLKHSVFTEDGTAVGSTLNIYSGNVGGDQVREFDIAYSQVGTADRWGVVFNVGWPATSNAALYFWQTPGASTPVVFGGFHGALGVGSVELPMLVGRPGHFLLTSLIHGTSQLTQEPQVSVGKFGTDAGIILPLTRATAFTGCTGVGCPGGVKSFPLPMASTAGPLKGAGVFLFGAQGSTYSTMISCN